MLHFALLLECQFWGNVTNIPAVLQPSSACQWFRLLTVYCQRFLHQPIVFLRCEANAYFIGSGCDNSLSFLFSGCRPCFSRLAASPLVALSRAWLTEEKTETARSLGRDNWFSVKTSFICYVLSRLSLCLFSIF